MHLYIILDVLVGNVQCSQLSLWLACLCRSSHSLKIWPKCPYNFWWSSTHLFHNFKQGQERCILWNLLSLLCQESILPLPRSSAYLPLGILPSSWVVCWLAVERSLRQPRGRTNQSQIIVIVAAVFWRQKAWLTNQSKTERSKCRVACQHPPRLTARQVSQQMLHCKELQAIFCKVGKDSGINGCTV